MEAKPIALPHFTMDQLQIKPITIQLSKVSSHQPKVSFSGLIDQHIREAMIRLGSAFRSIGLKFPQDHLTIHFTPAVYEKRGADYDLLLALGILKLFDLVPQVPERTLFISELGLGGELVGSERFLSYYHHALECLSGWFLVTSPENKAWVEAQNGPNPNLIAYASLTDIAQDLQKGTWAAAQVVLSPTLHRSRPVTPARCSLDEIQGLTQTKRAILSALVARVPLLLIGPPGVGKTFACYAAKDLLPELDFETWLGNHHWVSGQDLPPVNFLAPFRVPHYHSTLESFTGTFYRGQFVPGEFSLAGDGILFLDELSFFRPQVLEALRTPLENKTFLLSRAHFHRELPARFLLFAAMNPCPCGYYYFDSLHCRCTQQQVSRYLSRISGPLLERFGIVHLIHRDQELEKDERMARVTAQNIQKWREAFEYHYDSHGLQVELNRWMKLKQLSEGLLPINKRRERHMIRLALALSLIKDREYPESEDWEQAWSFQASSAFFGMQRL